MSTLRTYWHQFWATYHSLKSQEAAKAHRHKLALYHIGKLQYHEGKLQ